MGPCPHPHLGNFQYCYRIVQISGCAGQKIAEIWGCLPNKNPAYAYAPPHPQDIDIVLYHIKRTFSLLFVFTSLYISYLFYLFLIGSQLLMYSGKAESQSEAIHIMKLCISSGRALNKFSQMMQVRYHLLLSLICLLAGSSAGISKIAPLGKNPGSATGPLTCYKAVNR